MTIRISRGQAGVAYLDTKSVLKTKHQFASLNKKSPNSLPPRKAATYPLANLETTYVVSKPANLAVTQHWA